MIDELKTETKAEEDLKDCIIKANNCEKQNIERLRKELLLVKKKVAQQKMTVE